jgi:hypothetical protein
MAVSRQRLAKHVLAAADTNATVEEPYFLRGPWPRFYKQGTSLKLSSVRESVKRKLEPGGNSCFQEQTKNTRLCALVNSKVWK